MKEGLEFHIEFFNFRHFSKRPQSLRLKLISPKFELKGQTNRMKMAGKQVSDCYGAVSGWIR